MKIAIILFMLSAMWCQDVQAQSFIFGAKGGMTMGIQQWNGFTRDPLFRWHADAYVESWQEENRYAIFASLGYHVRGGTIRTRAWYDDQTMTEFDGGVTNMVFNNLVLGLGGKQKFNVGLDSRVYYLVGVRGEYTMGVDFDGGMVNYEGAQNNFVFGVTAGGGFEFPFSRYMGMFIEFSVQPDFTKQIFLPRQDTGFSDPSGNLIVLQEQNVYNLSLEFTVGFRFLREVIYVD